mgnify:CR=1 FL=1
MNQIENYSKDQDLDDQVFAQKNSSTFLSKFKNDAQCLSKEVITEVPECQIVSHEQFNRDIATATSSSEDKVD